MTYRLVHVGLGGQGSAWATDAIPPNARDDRIEVVAAVDTDPERHELAERELGLSPEACYTDLDTALSERSADICSVVTPPATHEAVIETALAHDLHIISEKPIADTLEASVRIAEKVSEAGKKMGVTMSHRFDRDKATFRRAVEAAGDVDYLTARYTGNVRERGFYADYVYKMDDMLLLDGAVHHLDILASLADSPCKRVYAETWTPEEADYDGDCTGFVTMHFADGTRAQYEGSYANATTLNGWGHEQFRAECSDQTVVLDRRDVERFHVDAYDTGNFESIGKGDGKPVPLAERPHWKNAWLIEQFCDWVGGGDPMPTSVDSVLESMAIVFAAIESSATGEAVDVQALLADARANA